jgi:hypothetical protein
MAQRISFGLYATEGITLEPVGLGELNFNVKQPIILANQSVNINKIDDASAILKITGRLDQEVIVTLSASPTLDLNTSHIPMSVRFAYYNTGVAYLSESEVKSSAIELPLGFTSVTFPFKKRLTGTPIPPPTPNHSGNVNAQGIAYIVVYGALGPVPSNAEIGNYQGDINIHVEYSTNP